MTSGCVDGPNDFAEDCRPSSAQLTRVWHVRAKRTSMRLERTPFNRLLGCCYSPTLRCGLHATPGCRNAGSVSLIDLKICPQDWAISPLNNGSPGSSSRPEKAQADLPFRVPSGFFRLLPFPVISPASATLVTASMPTATNDVNVATLIGKLIVFPPCDNWNCRAPLHQWQTDADVLDSYLIVDILAPAATRTLSRVPADGPLEVAAGGLWEPAVSLPWFCSFEFSHT